MTFGPHVRTPIGATPLPASHGGGTLFRVWAPKHERVGLLLGRDHERRLVMTPAADGYHELAVPGASPGTLYMFELAGNARPDPASRHQPEGPHGPSAIIDPNFPWQTPDFISPPLSRHVIYELHIGTFTPEGTFDAAIARVDDLRDLGVTAIEIMPIAQFPGGRNWGYDGVGLFAAQNTYGGPDGFRRLVDACHARGLAVILDVVYNHLGPEGNYLGEFGPYFTDKYRTPWGMSPNFDGPDSDHVRAFIIQNALYWTRDCRVDGLRLDAVHAIIDTSPTHLIAELAAAVKDAADRDGRRVALIAESAANDPRQMRPHALGGWGLDATWTDDFHHSIRTLVTGERMGYYADFGDLEHMDRAFTDAFVYNGRYSPSERKSRGEPAPDLPGSAFVVCTQNHDQVGNRMLGERLDHLVGLDAARLAAASVILSPFVPMLWMGEEYAEPAPFQYFVSHTDPALVEAVRKGRAEEFAAFKWAGEVPDPQSEETFNRCKLDWSKRTEARHAKTLAYYRELLRLRREVPALAAADRTGLRTRRFDADAVLFVLREHPESDALLALHFGQGTVTVEPDTFAGHWDRLLDAADPRWGGTGITAPERLAPRSAASSGADSTPGITLGPWGCALFTRSPHPRAG